VHSQKSHHPQSHCRRVAPNSYIVGRVPASQVAEGSTTNHAKSWIEECLKTHEACPSPRESLLPTRVIDLEAKSVQGASCLHITTKNETAGYATLSYCWGEAQKLLLLTTAVLKAWKERPPVENLSRSLQDAIEVTRALEIRYAYTLWKYCLLLFTYLRETTSIYTFDPPCCLRLPRSAVSTQLNPRLPSV
jgi:hypothetical protein